MTIEGLGVGGMSADALDALTAAEERGGLDELRDIVAEERRRGRIASEIEQLLADYAAGILDADAVLAMCERRLNGLDAQIQTIMGDLENANTRATEIGSRLGELRNLQEWLRENADPTSSGWSNESLEGPENELTLENMRRWVEESGVDPNGFDYAASLRAWGVPASDIARITTPGSVDRFGLVDHLADAGVSDPAINAALTAAPEPLTRDAVRDILVDHGVAPESAERIAASLPAARGVPASVRAYMDLHGHAEFTNATELNEEITSLNEELTTSNSNNEMLMIRLQTLMQQRTSVLQMSSNMLKAMDEANDNIVGNLR